MSRPRSTPAASRATNCPALSIVPFTPCERSAPADCSSTKGGWSSCRGGPRFALPELLRTEDCRLHLTVIDVAPVTELAHEPEPTMTVPAAELLSSGAADDRDHPTTGCSGRSRHAEGIKFDDGRQEISQVNR